MPVDNQSEKNKYSETSTRQLIADLSEHIKSLNDNKDDKYRFSHIALFVLACSILSFSTGMLVCNNLLPNKYPYLTFVTFLLTPLAVIFSSAIALCYKFRKITMFLKDDIKETCITVIIPFIATIASGIVLAFNKSESLKKGIFDTNFFLSLLLTSIVLFLIVYYLSAFRKPSNSQIAQALRQLGDNLKEIDHADAVATELGPPKKAKATLQTIAEEEEAMLRLELLTKCRRKLSFLGGPPFIQYSKYLFDDIFSYKYIMILGEFGYLATAKGVKQLVEVIKHNTLDRLYLCFYSRGENDVLDGDAFNKHIRNLMDVAKLDKDLRDSLCQRICYVPVNDVSYTGTGMIALSNTSQGDANNVLIEKVYCFVPFLLDHNNDGMSPWEKHPFVLSWNGHNVNRISDYFGRLLLMGRSIKVSSYAREPKHPNVILEEEINIIQQQMHMTRG